VKIANFVFFVLFASCLDQIVRPITTNEGSICVLLRREVPFGGLDNKTMFMGQNAPKHDDFSQPLKAKSAKYSNRDISKKTNSINASFEGQLSTIVHKTLLWVV